MTLQSIETNEQKIVIDLNKKVDVLKLLTKTLLIKTNK